MGASQPHNLSTIILCSFWQTSVFDMESFFNNAMKNIQSRNLPQVASCVRAFHLSNLSMIEDKYIIKTTKPKIPKFQNFVWNTLLCFVHSYIFLSSFLEYENEILDMHQSQSCSRAYHKARSKNTAVISA